MVYCNNDNDVVKKIELNTHKHSVIYNRCMLIVVIYLWIYQTLKVTSCSYWNPRTSHDKWSNQLEVYLMSIKYALAHFGYACASLWTSRFLCSKRYYHLIWISGNRRINMNQLPKKPRGTISNNNPNTSRIWSGLDPPFGTLRIWVHIR